MKEQDKIPKEKLSDTEIGYLPEKEYTVMIIKIIHEFRERKDAQTKMLQVVFNTELENVKNNQTQLKKKKITEMKNTLERMKSQISELEDREV